MNYEELYARWEKRSQEAHLAQLELLKLKIEVTDICLKGMGFHPASDVLAKQVVARLMQQSSEQLEANRER